ncbi:hypothetical protein LTR97_010121 [Elasticomyces elasticus]|uniref:Uncharacterized protein n=1 Tax=Elasticomyces elasticus TaxID=574655 RepID=A0AAN7VNU5_9PEZI|nr:hypothetical protein LTR97_010121 [Elasticomyces elasticus]
MVRRVRNTSGKPEAQSPAPTPPVHYEGAAKASSSTSAAGEEHESLSQQLAKALSANEEQRRSVDRLIKALDAADIGGKTASNSSGRIRHVGPQAAESGQPLNRAMDVSIVGVSSLKFDHPNETTDVELVVYNPYMLEQRVFYVQSSSIERTCPGLFQLWANRKSTLGFDIDDDTDGPIRVQRTWSADAVQEYIYHAYTRVCVPRYSPPTKTLKHLWNVMLLAAEWGMPIFLENVPQQFMDMASTLQMHDIYLLTVLLVVAYRCPRASELIIRAKRTVTDAATARSTYILKDTASLWLLNEPGALAMFLADLAGQGYPTGQIQQHIAMHGASRDQVVCGFPGCLHGAAIGGVLDWAYLKSCFKNIWTIAEVPRHPGIMGFVPSTFNTAALSY